MNNLSHLFGSDASDVDFFLFSDAFADAVLGQLTDEQFQVPPVDSLIVDATIGEQPLFFEGKHLDSLLAEVRLGLCHVCHVGPAEDLPDVGVLEQPELANSFGFCLEDYLEEFPRHGLDEASVAEDYDFEEASEVHSERFWGRIQELILIQILQLTKFQSLHDEANQVLGAVMEGALHVYVLGLGFQILGAGLCRHRTMIRQIDIEVGTDRLRLLRLLRQFCVVFVERVLGDLLSRTPKYCAEGAVEHHSSLLLNINLFVIRYPTLNVPFKQIYKLFRRFTQSPSCCTTRPRPKQRHDHPSLQIQFIALQLLVSKSSPLPTRTSPFAQLLLAWSTSGSSSPSKFLTATRQDFQVLAARFPNWKHRESGDKVKGGW